MGISVFFSMIKAIKILNGIKYLEIMKGTYFRAGDDLRNHLIFMVCIFGGFVHASRVLFKETHDFSSPMRATQMVLGFSDWILEFPNYAGHMVAIRHKSGIYNRLDFTLRLICLIFIRFLVAGTYFIIN